jgi:hypothetical protein
MNDGSKKSKIIFTEEELKELEEALSHDMPPVTMIPKVVFGKE